MRISDWSSDVCSSDLGIAGLPEIRASAEDRSVERRGKLQQAREQGIVVHRNRRRLENCDARVRFQNLDHSHQGADRKSVVSGKSVSVSVDLGGRRTIKKKTKQ